MPLPALAASAIGSAISGGINMGASLWTRASDRRHALNQYNRELHDANNMFGKQSQFNFDMFDRQKQHNIDMWNMQNQYNEMMYNKYQSPEALMKQYLKAGINPHAMYGNMSGGSIDAATLANAQQQSAPNVGLPSSRVPTSQLPSLNLENGISSIMQARQIGVQTDNLKAQENNIYLDGLLKTQDILGKQLNNENQSYQNKILKDTWFESADLIRYQLKKIQNDISISQNNDRRAEDANVRANEKQPYEIGYLVQQIRNARLNGNLSITSEKGKQLENTLKQLDINLKSKGLQPTDNIIFRALGQDANLPVIEKTKKTITDLIDDFRKGYNKYNDSLNARHQRSLDKAKRYFEPDTTSNFYQLLKNKYGHR